MFQPEDFVAALPSCRLHLNSERAGVSGGLSLIPRGKDLDALIADYQFMIDEGLLRDDTYGFDTLIVQCTALQEEANRYYF
jgi:hypothetical protein